ncbi:UDP-glucuronosyl/UDP-glucosyltransferase family and Dynactin p62 family-containing protein [Strongyloides ratti]|uniref:glucuronosyltransferase n=1 Tax=Strongyloides ratti TaxID=34506 RepID=A0A090LD69_STRRB|nr:UDP-glucuronosyl/UDP-glucosyltransferase family and Dynactin p62 family-containing protein [Strongyloides ratti]CEF67701.1 UDP-glucuronosyl/UDP-glucosyltransferase family and Dynactin p62 family-containing protein [Strongyloides ratti]
MEKGFPSHYDAVLYECSCGSYEKYSKLLFCCECRKFACEGCCKESLDTTFCPFCFECSTLGEFNSKKNRCFNCRLCPLCFSYLVIKSTNEDKSYFKCNSCFWTSRESGLSDRTNHRSYPDFDNKEMEDEVASLSEYLKKLANIVKKSEKIRSIKKKENFSNNKYQLQRSYEQKLKKTKFEDEIQVPTVVSVSDIPEIDESYIMEDVQGKLLPTLDQKIEQYGLGLGKLQPIPAYNVCKKTYRCLTGDHLLCRLEYSLSTVKFKIFSTAWTFLPQIKVVPKGFNHTNEWNNLMLVVKNSSASVVRVKLLPLRNDDSCYVECFDPDVEFTLTAKDDAFEIDESFSLFFNEQRQEDNPLTFRKGCRAGLNFKVKPKVDGDSSFFNMKVKFSPIHKNDDGRDSICHILFNYRLAETLKSLDHDVFLWTQMEMNMVVKNVLGKPEGVNEIKIPITFKDKLKIEGLKVFQSMMFNKDDAYDLWWTGQEFKEMRLESCEQMLNIGNETLLKLKNENFDIAIGHFHDLCPLALAKTVNVKKLIWVTHGTSVYDFAAIQMGLRTFPASISHPLSSYSDEMSFYERIINLFWHLSTLDFVNLPQNLLYEENFMYKKRKEYKDNEDLWDLSKNVPILFINGERFLDFPRPFPLGITFMGEVGKKSSSKNLPEEIEAIIKKANKGIILFSLGTVSNTTNMPKQMIHSFVEGFGQFPEYQILWRMEMNIPEASKYENINLLKWLPQKALMKHPKTKLLIAHGGYNSFLEASQTGVPVILMPLFADQFINAKRAQRFGIAEVLDKLSLTPEKVSYAMNKVLKDPIYSINAKKLSLMLNDKPSNDSYAILRHRIKLAVSNRPLFMLQSSQKLNFIQFYNLDQILILVGTFIILSL